MKKDGYIIKKHSCFFCIHRMQQCRRRQHFREIREGWPDGKFDGRYRCTGRIRGRTDGARRFREDSSGIFFGHRDNGRGGKTCYQF
ncbi:hypothetical protein [Extibacter sp. GGCC_0201]|uniref:hypothetical protein n=1 Tax=Extibacter sp. GGCC_0201 TaxID=2731209 RepID=UPI001FB61685|nr:hypothetical protein [Extibacter sp. GGCC_0201]